MKTGISAISSWNKDTTINENLFKNIGLYLEHTTYEISCPALRDSSLAPEGKTGIIISTLMDYRLVKHLYDTGNYNQFKEYCTKKVVEVMESTIFSGILEKIEFALCSTPLTIERETGNAHGAITGWSFSNDGMPAENRFRKIKNSINTPIKNIYQCGQWTFSPSGLPISILTGKLAADEIHKKLKVRGS